MDLARNKKMTYEKFHKIKGREAKFKEEEKT